jgi:hypothetical protein
MFCYVSRRRVLSFKNNELLKLGNETLTSTISSTRPLQLINTPIVKLSRHTSLQALAARVPPMIFPANAIVITPITYAQVMPSLSSPRLVLKPERAK